MQFKCSSCQAKYQIADEKVAGKTVRMKCRKCGATIEVRAKVTEDGLVGVPVPERDSSAAAPQTQPSGVAWPGASSPGPGAVGRPPSSPGAPARPPSGSGLPVRPPSGSGLPVRPPSGSGLPVRPPSGPGVPGRAPGVPELGGAPPSGLGPPVAPPRAPLGPPRAAPGRPPGRPLPPAPRGPGAPPAPEHGGLRRPTGAGPARASDVGAPAAPFGLAPGVRPFGPTSQLRRTSPGDTPPPPDLEDEDESTVVVARPALDLVRAASARRLGAGLPDAPPAAGSSAVGQPAPSEPAAQAGAPPSSGAGPQQEPEQWFVGLGGRPVGPKTKSFLREKLRSGEIDASALVWKEDFADWRPLEGVAELASLLAPGPGAATPSESASVADAARSYPSAPGSGTSVPPPAPSAPVALVRVKEEDAVAFDQGPAQLAASAASARSVGARVDGPPAGVAGGSAEAAAGGDAPAGRDGADGARPTTSPGQPGTGLVSDLDEDELGRSRRERRRRSRGVKPVAWAFVAMAGAFGGVAAYVVFALPPDPSGTAVVGAAAGTPGEVAAGPTGTGEVGDTAAGTASTIVLDPVSVEPGANGSGQPMAVGTGASTSTSAAGTPSDIDLSGFNTAGPSGPSSGPGSSGGSQSQSELTSADISSVVARYKGGVSRRCLPLVEAGGVGGATSARVVAHLLIGPSGSVQSASASGGKEFPGLADCVAGRVRGWKFPSSSGTTPVDVPFHFIAQ